MHQQTNKSQTLKLEIMKNKQKRAQNVINVFRNLFSGIINLMTLPIQVMLLIIEILLLVTVVAPIYSYIKNGSCLTVSNFIWSLKPSYKYKSGNCPAIQFNQNSGFKSGYDVTCWYWFAETKYVYPEGSGEYSEDKVKDTIGY